MNLCLCLINLCLTAVGFSLGRYIYLQYVWYAVAAETPDETMDTRRGLAQEVAELQTTFGRSAHGETPNVSYGLIPPESETTKNLMTTVALEGSQSLCEERRSALRVRRGLRPLL